MKTVKLKFDGESEECFVETKANGEVVCHTADGRFLKFPKGIDLKDAVKAHNEANAEKPMAADEEDKQAKELAEWRKEQKKSNKNK
jgi:hypothetical protein